MDRRDPQPPLVKGGQGRSDHDLQLDAVAFFATAGRAVAAIGFSLFFVWFILEVTGG